MTCMLAKGEHSNQVDGETAQDWIKCPNDDDDRATWKGLSLEIGDPHNATHFYTLRPVVSKKKPEKFSFTAVFEHFSGLFLST